MTSKICLHASWVGGISHLGFLFLNDSNLCQADIKTSQHTVKSIFSWTMYQTWKHTSGLTDLRPTAAQVAEKDQNFHMETWKARPLTTLGLVFIAVTVTTAHSCQVLCLARWCTIGSHHSPPCLWAVEGSKADLVPRTTDPATTVANSPENHIHACGRYR